MIPKRKKIGENSNIDDQTEMNAHAFICRKIISTVFLVLTCYGVADSMAADTKYSDFITKNGFDVIFEYYKVKAGDTLWKISKKFNVSIQELRRVNRLLNETITIGQRLLVPLNPIVKRPINKEKKEEAQQLIKQAARYRNKGQYQKSIELYNRAIQTDPYEIKALYGLGFANLKQGSYPESIEFFKQAIRIDPYNAESHYNLGLVYFRLKKKNSAFQQYRILKILNENFATRLLMYIDSLK
jgi:tetratricopeptide (TPR) repeat protein